MLEFDKKSNLLMTNRYQYSLQDVAEPNLYRELYDYESIPKVAFNMRHVPENMPDEIWMTDTTFRDGQQSVSPFTVEQIVHLYSLMHRLGGPKGLIRQSEFFLYTDKDKKALHACQDLRFSRNHDVDSRQREGLRAGQAGRREGDRHPCLLLGLPHFQEDAPDTQTGDEQVSGHRQGCT